MHPLNIFDTWICLISTTNDFQSASKEWVKGLHNLQWFWGFITVGKIRSVTSSFFFFFFHFFDNEVCMSEKSSSEPECQRRKKRYQKTHPEFMYLEQEGNCTGEQNSHSKRKHCKPNKCCKRWGKSRRINQAKRMKVYKNNSGTGKGN